MSKIMPQGYAHLTAKIDELKRELAAEKEWVRQSTNSNARLEKFLAEAQAEISATRRWVNNNMTFYDVEPDGPDVCTSGPNIPTLCAVSKRIWYHATDNQTVSLFSEVIDLRKWEGK
jgi:hypothetical protein